MNSKKDGSTAILDLTTAMIPWAAESVILVTFRDASDRSRAEREGEKLIREPEDALDKIKSLRVCFRSARTAKNPG